MTDIIFETKFGSHLYGLQTPTSDCDFKGIILPSRRRILLGQSKFHLDRSTNKSSEKNTSDDIDRTYYSLSYFIELAIAGETVALDMCHASEESFIQTSDIWKYIQSNRSRFYTKSMKSYMGYVYKQAAKYGIRGSRISAIEEVIYIISKFLDMKLKDLFSILPINDYCKIVKNPKFLENRGYAEFFYEVCGSKFADNLSLKYVRDSLEIKLKSYGERAQLAKFNQGVDFKAVSHALRAGYQLRSIFKNGTFSYPLKESDFIMRVKLGQLDFLTEIEPELYNLINEINQLSEESSLPESVEREFWEDFICEVHFDIVGGF